MAAKLARWILFTVLFSLIPLAVDFVAEAARSGGKVSVASFGRHGELYLLASAICAVGIGEILGVNEKYKVYKIIGGGTSALTIASTTALYTISASDAAQTLAHQANDQVAYNEHVAQLVLSYSIYAFLFACIVSTSCVALSEVK